MVTVLKPQPLLSFPEPLQGTASDMLCDPEQISFPLWAPAFLSVQGQLGEGP